MALRDECTQCCSNGTYNVAGFVVTRPPLVIFLVFILALCMSLISLAYYVENNPVTDVDATQLWSNFLGNVAGLYFCLNNQSEPFNQSVVLGNTELDQHDIMHVSLSTMVTVSSVNNASVSMSDPVHTIHGFIPSFYVLNKDGNYPRQIMIVVNLVKPVSVSGLVDTEACVRFALPRKAFPADSPHLTCNVSTANPGSSPGVVQADVVRKLKNAASPCPARVLQMRVLARNLQVDNPVLLDMMEKSIVRFRLHMVSYFLFVVFLSAVLYMTIKKRSKLPSSPAKMLAT